MSWTVRRPRSVEFTSTVEEELYGLHSRQLEELCEALCFVGGEVETRSHPLGWHGTRASRAREIQWLSRRAAEYDITSYADLCTFLQQQLYQQPSVSLWHWSLQTPPSPRVCPVWWIDQVWLIPLPSQGTWKGQRVGFNWEETCCHARADQTGFCLSVPLSHPVHDFDEVILRVKWNQGRAHLHPTIQECLVEELCAPHPSAHLTVMPLSEIDQVLQTQKVRLLQELDPFLIPDVTQLVVNFLS